MKYNVTFELCSSEWVRTKEPEHWHKKICIQPEINLCVARMFAEVFGMTKTTRSLSNSLGIKVPAKVPCNESEK